MMDKENKENIDRISALVRSGKLAAQVSDELVPKIIFVCVGEKPGTTVVLDGTCSPTPNYISDHNPDLYNEFLRSVKNLTVEYEINTEYYPSKLLVTLAKDTDWLQRNRTTDRQMGEFYGFPKREIDDYVRHTGRPNAAFQEFVNKKTMFNNEELSRARRFTHFVPRRTEQSILKAVRISSRRADLLESIETAGYDSMQDEISDQLEEHIHKDQLLSEKIL